MYLLYLDASGTPDVGDPMSTHYVLAGLCMRDGSWFGLDKRLRKLKARYQFSGLEFELHVKQFAVTISEQDEIPDFDQLSWTDRRSQVLAIRRRKLDAETDSKKRELRRSKYRETLPFIHLSRRERSELLEEAVALIATHNGIRLFGEAINKRHPLMLDGTHSPTRQAFEQVVSRFDTFLKKKDSWKLQANPRRMIDYGLLILDQDPSTEARIDRLFQSFRQDGHSFGRLDHVIDVPFFASSAKVSGLQIADVCAYVIRRYLETGAKLGSHEERQFMSLFPRFDRDNYGKLHGLRHYVAAGTCHCVICRERGHAPMTAPGEPA